VTARDGVFKSIHRVFTYSYSLSRKVNSCQQMRPCSTRTFPAGQEMFRVLEGAAFKRRIHSSRPLVSQFKAIRHAISHPTSSQSTLVLCIALVSDACYIPRQSLQSGHPILREAQIMLFLNLSPLSSCLSVTGYQLNG
jgi:hypothetical protein